MRPIQPRWRGTALACMLGLLGAICVPGCASTPPAPGTNAFERHELARRERALQRSPQRRRDLAREAQVQALMCRIAPLHCNAVRVYLLQRDVPVAELGADGVLRIHLELLDLVGSEDELAFMLAHELAHRVLDHFAARSDTGWNLDAAELQADAWAQVRLAELGFERCAGAALLGRIAQHKPLQPEARAQLSKRLAAFACAAPD